MQYKVKWKINANQSESFTLYYDVPHELAAQRQWENTKAFEPLPYTSHIVSISPVVPYSERCDIITKTTEVPSVSEVNKLRKDLKAAVKRIEALEGKGEG